VYGIFDRDIDVQAMAFAFQSQWTADGFGEALFLRKHAQEFITEYVCGPRICRAIRVIVFKHQEPEECQRVSDYYRALMEAYGKSGYRISLSLHSILGKRRWGDGDYSRSMRRH
jgi:hypothetical protein